MEPLDVFRKGWNTDGPIYFNENSTLPTLILKQAVLVLDFFVLENIIYV